MHRANSKSSKGKTTNNLQGALRKANSWSFSRNVADQKGVQDILKVTKGKP